MGREFAQVDLDIAQNIKSRIENGFCELVAQKLRNLGAQKTVETGCQNVKKLSPLFEKNVLTARKKRLNF